MANIIYTKFLEQLANGGLDFDDTGTGDSKQIVAMLERSTSTYTPNKDDDFVSDLTNFVEITASGYSRQAVSGEAVNIDDANDRVELDIDDVNFGSIAAGQTVKAIILYLRTGADDSTPADDILICRIDTDSGGLLPAATAGGAFQMTINAEGLIQMSQP